MIPVQSIPSPKHSADRLSLISEFIIAMNRVNYTIIANSKDRLNVGTESSINHIMQQEAPRLDLTDNPLSISLNSNIMVENGFSLVFDAESDQKERSAPRWPILTQRAAPPCHDLRDFVDGSMAGRGRLWNDRQIKKFDSEVFKPIMKENAKFNRAKNSKDRHKKENDDPIANLENDFSCSMEEDHTIHNLSLSETPDLTFADFKLFTFQEIFITEFDLVPLIKKFNQRVEIQREYTCKYCGQLFIHSTALGGHISKTHTNPKNAKGQAPSTKRIKHST